MARVSLTMEKYAKTEGEFHHGREARRKEF
jgi:hypothetical protein